jgi:hypothetical protein
MTLTAEMLRISSSFGDSKSKRSTEINKMRESLARQIVDGREAVLRMSSELHKAIQSDLKNISKNVAKNKKETWSLLHGYKTGRKSNAVELKARLEIDRTRLATLVEEVLLGFEKDRTTARSIIRKSAASRKINSKQSVESSIIPSVVTQEITVEIEVPTPPVKATNPTSAMPPIKATSPTTATPPIKGTTPTTATPPIKGTSPTTATPPIKATSPTPATLPVKTGSPTPAGHEFSKTNSKK